MRNTGDRPIQVGSHFLGGKRFVNGFNNLVDGWTGDGPRPDYRPNLDAAMERGAKLGFKIGTPPDEPPAPQKPAGK